MPNWNERDANTIARNNWRASLVPAAAVIPAPIAYIKVVAVKTLVVDAQGRAAQWPTRPVRRASGEASVGIWLSAGRVSPGYCDKREVLKEGAAAGTHKHGITEYVGRTRWFGTAKMRNRDGWGHWYSGARGEILGFPDDRQVRRRLPGTCLLIKNES